MAHHCTNASAIIICKHVSAGNKADVYLGSTQGTEFAVCFACADAINEFPMESQALLETVCQHHATELGIPLVMPGDGYYDANLQLMQPADDEGQAPRKRA